ncbi:bifunctional coenzyme A synthase [Galendromus occidentalis]|uniref:Bifunctional coenzyme A synthase n=1 Tax=Galendromus occidentalis TaxID=34638 RepID=A0AAJ6QQ65_9ACAR|nr:bifunctional coenzyme A synthase [Galendromus occidentalis]
MLVIAAPLQQILDTVSALLHEARQLVDQTLYIRLEPGYQWPCRKTIFTSEEVSLLRAIVLDIYREAARECSHLDVRVLQGFLKNSDSRTSSLDKKVDVIIAQNDFVHLEEYVRELFAVIPSVRLVPPVIAASGTEDAAKVVDSITFDSVCVGGTFDRLHLGHKLLLSAAVARATERLVIGVTDGDMIKSKVLWELIEPLEVRMSALRKCLNDMDPTLKYDILPIYEPFGPTIRDRSLQCLCVSDETIKGGLKVNEERANKDFPPMALFNVSLLPEQNKMEKFMDDKISSSSKRIALLGEILRKPRAHPSFPEYPFVVGLTGGICAGKSRILTIFESLGLTCISADKLGHEAYSPGTELNQILVDTFGTAVRAADGTIDRKELGAIVFADADKRDRLNQLVWPEIEKSLQREIAGAGRAGARVVVVEAALLFEAGWDRLAHLVCYTLISEKEAISRVMVRDKCGYELALKKIHSQKPAKMFIDRAHMILSSMWDERATEQQVHRAFEEIVDHVQGIKTHSG